MELRQLRHFLAVVDHGSFSRAADALSLTPQALSKSLSSLEHSLSVRLLDRTTRHVSLTSHGEMLLSHARVIAAEAAQYQRHVEDSLGVRSGRLAVGAGATAAGTWVADAVHALTTMRPQLHVSVTDGNAAILVPLLLRGQLDVLVCVVNDALNDPLIAEETLFVERVSVIAGSGHPLAGRKRLTLDEIAKYPWLVGWNAGGLDARVRQEFDAAGRFPPTARIETNSVWFIRAMLIKNQVLGVFPDDLFRHELGAGSLVVLDVDAPSRSWSRPLTLLYRKKSTRSPATMAFIRALRDAVAASPPNSSPAD